jgi:hypothetical protein
LVLIKLGVSLGYATKMEYSRALFFLEVFPIFKKENEINGSCFLQKKKIEIVASALTLFKTLTNINENFTKFSNYTCGNLYQVFHRGRKKEKYEEEDGV